MMKKLFFIISAFFIINISFAQEEIKIKNSDVRINTADNTNTVSYVINFKLKDGYRHRQEIFNVNNKDVNAVISIENEKGNSKTNYTCKIRPGHFDIVFKVEADSALIEKILSGQVGYFIEIDKNLIIEIVKDGEDPVKYVLTKEQVKKATIKKQLKDEMNQEMLESLGGEIKLVENNIDFGLIPSEESNSGKTEYFVDFSYSNGYKLFDFPLTVNTEGKLSTNSKDSLNYFEFYPVGYKFNKGKSVFSFNAGFEGDQSLSNYRATGDVYWQGILPNLINLTYNENRLRLKPVLKVGIKLYKEIENNRPVDNDNQFSNMFYVDAYYYIPVMKAYSIILEGGTFYDFNTKTNPDNELKYSYSLTFGVEIPKTGLKTIFKYTNGESEINYTSTNYFMIGLMADLFTDKSIK